jgi:rare lipoprotein A
MKQFIVILLLVWSVAAAAQDTVPVRANRTDTPVKPVMVLMDTLTASSDTTIVPIAADSMATAIDSALYLDSIAKESKVMYGLASFYSRKFHGRRTANGEIFSLYKMTCACNKVPLGTWLRVTNLKNGKSIVVKVNDRLHPRMKRLVDLTLAGARQLNFINAGLTRVKVEILGKNPPVRALKNK